MVNYRVFKLDEDGELRDVTETSENPIPMDMVRAMNVGKEICLILAKGLGKDWDWNKNYPKDVIEKVAELVAYALKR